MSKVYFMNNGDFDVRAMLTMGVSAKEGDAIGFFGTGFKYAIAIILRLGGSITVSTSSGVYEFKAKKETIRGKEFQIVYMNDREAGFTTHLGVNWEPWMAYRELYCNALDEGGVTDTAVDTNYDTIIEVDCPDILSAHNDRDSYILNKTPDYKGGEVDVFLSPLPFIYYKGIAVSKARDKSCLGYNIKGNITLTEDRTVKYAWDVDWKVKRTLQSCTDKRVLEGFLCARDSFESYLEFDKGNTTSEEFIQVAESMLSTDRGLNENARVLLSQLDVNEGQWPEFTPSDVQRIMMERAKKFLGKMDIPVDKFPIKTVRGLGKGVMGRAYEGVIYLSDIPFNMGTKQVASTLLEEYVHLNHGVEDFDRNMQNWLFDKIISLGENINQEPI